MTLRHSVASLAYRAAKAVRDLPPEQASFRASADTRSIAEILAHMGDLFDWALALANGEKTWRDSQPLEWSAEVERFFAAMTAFDARLASGEPLAVSEERLFQGPIADALTHAGQIAMLRRLAGAAMRGENYFLASIEAGRTGLDQVPAKREF